MIKNKRIETVVHLLLMAALFWIVRYWHSQHFGLYEDDLTIIPQAFQMSFGKIIQFIYSEIVNFEGQGRPLHHSFIYLFSWLGWQIGGLWGPYWVGYAITVLNISLFYFLLKRISNSTWALLGGCAYLLFSADTTQAYLTLSLGVQPSLTLILLAYHCYWDNKRLLAYLFAFLVLLGYETPFLVFLGAPLLIRKWDKSLIKELIIHGVLMGLMVALIYAVRLKLNGAGGVLNLTAGQMVWTSLLHMVQGPVVDLGTYAYRPLQTLMALNLEGALVILPAFVFFLWIFSRFPMTPQVRLRDLWQALKDPASRRGLPDELKALGRLFVGGIVALVMAYPLTFTVRAYAISGRDTRVHTAGVIGSALLVAAAVLFLIRVSNGSAWRKFVNILIALEFALMVGYGFVIQRDYVRAWQYQREFWTELVPLIPDAGEGTVVLVDPAALHDTLQIGANYWNLPRVLDQLYLFPPEINAIPVVHRLDKGWENTLVGADGLFQVNAVTTYSAPERYGSFRSQQIILIQSEHGHLVRREAVTLKGQEYSLKPLTAPVLPSLPHGFLYSLMIIQP